MRWRRLAWLTIGFILGAALTLAVEVIYGVYFQGGGH